MDIWRRPCNAIIGLVSGRKNHTDKKVETWKHGFSFKMKSKVRNAAGIIGKERKWKYLVAHKVLYY